MLSLAATGRLDVIAPYPPYFCAEQSGDELKSRSRESLLSSEVRLVFDLLQVNHTSFGVEWPSKLSDLPGFQPQEGSEVAERKTRLPKVDLSPLEGFHMHFVPKMSDLTFNSDYLCESLN